jgi:hypothetical protein
MNPQKVEWYLDAIKEEISRLNDKEFVGNVDFKLNIKCGAITNMNIVLSKSVKEQVLVA